jgi:hypothetical protein
VVGGAYIRQFAGGVLGPGIWALAGAVGSRAWEDADVGRGGGSGCGEVAWAGTTVRGFSNDQVSKNSENLPNWALILYGKMPRADHPHTKKSPTSNFWHRIVLHAFLPPKCGRWVCKEATWASRSWARLMSVCYAAVVRCWEVPRGRGERAAGALGRVSQSLAPLSPLRVPQCPPAAGRRRRAGSRTVTAGGGLPARWEGWGRRAVGGREAGEGRASWREAGSWRGAGEGGAGRGGRK